MGYGGPEQPQENSKAENVLLKEDVKHFSTGSKINNFSKLHILWENDLGCLKRRVYTRKFDNERPGALSTGKKRD